MATIEALPYTVIMAIYSFGVLVLYLILLKKVTSNIGKIIFVFLWLGIGVFGPILMLSILITPGEPSRYINALLWVILWAVPGVFVKRSIYRAQGLGSAWLWGSSAKKDIEDE